jgi:hypothetical protein
MKRGKYNISTVRDLKVGGIQGEVEVMSYYGVGPYNCCYNGVTYNHIKQVFDEVDIKARFLERNSANFATVTRAVLRERREFIKVYTSRAIIANVAAAFYGDAGFEKNVIMTHEHKGMNVFGQLQRVLNDRFVFYHDVNFTKKLFSQPLAILFGITLKLMSLYYLFFCDFSLFSDSFSFAIRVPKLLYMLVVKIVVLAEKAVMDIRIPDYGNSPLEKMPPLQPDNVVSSSIHEHDGENFLFLQLLNILWFVSIPLYFLLMHYMFKRVHIYTKIINGMKVYFYRTDYENIDCYNKPTVSSDTPLKFHKRGFIEQHDPSRRAEKDKNLYPLLGNINGFTPNNTCGTDEFTETAINLRWVECGPSEALSVSSWKNLHTWYEKLLNSFKRPEALDEITIPMFQEWISRYTGLKLKMLLKGVEHLNIVNNDTLSHAGWSAFIKREKLYKTMDGEIKPRGIVHANPVYNVFFGPWFYNMYKKIKELITLNNLPITIASGINRSKLSSIVSDLYNNKGFDHIYENDFTQFEKTHTLGAYILEGIFYKFLGMPSYLVDNYIRLHGKTKAKTSKYSAFDIDFARFSGDQTTSLGNSMVNAFVTYFVLRFIFGFKDDEFHLIVLGDDILIFTTHAIDITRLSDELSKFGFKSKLREATIMDATFLSMNFLKCEDGSYYAFPKIGKFLLSRSHCTSVSGRDDPQGVLKANFLSENKYTRTHPVLGPFVKSVLQSMKNYKVKKNISSEVNELSKYRLNQEEDGGYYSNVEQQYFNDYMFLNYGLSVENVRDMNFNLSLLGSRHDGIKDPYVDVILTKECL